MVRVNLPSLLGAVALSALSALSLAGCYEAKDGQHYLSEKSRKEADAEYVKKANTPKSYFSEIPLHHNLSTASVAITSGDFDKDGDLDIVVANLDDKGTRLYFFEGNGHGGFKLRDNSE